MSDAEGNLYSRGPAEEVIAILRSQFRGVDESAILDRIEDGESIAQIATDLGCNRSTLWRWLEQPQRSAGATRARQLAAMAWDDKAEKGIEDAADPFELSKAKEMAHHYRWRAAKISPTYADKAELKHSGAVQFHKIECVVVDPAG